MSRSRHGKPPLQPGRRLLRRPVRRQSAGRGARRRGSGHRGHAEIRVVDEPVGDVLSAAGGGPSRRLPDPDLHPHPGVAVRGPPHLGQRPRLADGRGDTQERGRDRSGVRGRSRASAPDRDRSGLRCTTTAALRTGGRRAAATRRRDAESRPDRDRRRLVAGQRAALDRPAAGQCRGGPRGPPGRRRRRHRDRRPLPAGLGGEPRGPCLLPARGIHRRGSGHGQSERRPGPVDARLRPTQRPVRRPAGHRPRTLGSGAHHRRQ